VAAASGFRDGLGGNSPGVPGVRGLGAVAVVIGAVVAAGVAEVEAGCVVAGVAPNKLGVAVEVAAGAVVVVALGNRLEAGAAVVVVGVGGARAPNMVGEAVVAVEPAVVVAVDAAGWPPNRPPEGAGAENLLLNMPPEGVAAVAGCVGCAGVVEAGGAKRPPPNEGVAAGFPVAEAAGFAPKRLDAAVLDSAGGAPAGVVDVPSPNNDGFAGVAAPLFPPKRLGVVPAPA